MAVFAFGERPGSAKNLSRRLRKTFGKEDGPGISTGVDANAPEGTRSAVSAVGAITSAVSNVTETSMSLAAWLGSIDPRPLPSRFRRRASSRK
jgi:hypothetical protein